MQEGAQGWAGRGAGVHGGAVGGGDCPPGAAGAARGQREPGTPQQSHPHVPAPLPTWAGRWAHDQLGPTGTDWGCGAAPGATRGANRVTQRHKPTGTSLGLPAGGMLPPLTPPRGCPSSGAAPAFRAAERGSCRGQRPSRQELLRAAGQDSAGRRGSPRHSLGKEERGCGSGESCRGGKLRGCCPAVGVVLPSPTLPRAAAERPLPLCAPRQRGSTRTLGRRTPLLARDPPNGRPFHATPARTPPRSPASTRPGSAGAHRPRGPRPGCVAREQSSLLRGCWQPAEPRGRLPVPVLPAAHPAPPARAPSPAAGSAPGSPQPRVWPAGRQRQQTTPGGAEPQPCLAHGQEPAPSACPHPGARRGCRAGHPRPGAASGRCWGCGARRDAEPRGEKRQRLWRLPGRVAVPMGGWDAVPGYQAPLARPPGCAGYALPWPRASPRPSDGSVPGPISSSPSSQPTAPRASRTEALRPPALGGATLGTGCSPARAGLGRAHRPAALPRQPSAGTAPTPHPRPSPQPLPFLPCTPSRGTEHWDNWDRHNTARGRTQGAPILGGCI